MTQPPFFTPGYTPIAPSQQYITVKPLSPKPVEAKKFLEFKELINLLSKEPYNRNWPAHTNNNFLTATSRAPAFHVLNQDTLFADFGLPKSEKDQWGNERATYAIEQISFEIPQPYDVYWRNRQTPDPTGPVFIKIGFNGYLNDEWRESLKRLLRPVQFEVTQAAIVLDKSYTGSYTATRHYVGYQNGSWVVVLSANYKGQQVCFVLGFTLAEHLFSFSLTEDFEFSVQNKTFPISDDQKLGLLGIQQNEAITLREVDTLATYFNQENFNRLLLAAHKRNLLNLKPATGSGIQKTSAVAQHFAQQLTDDPMATIIMNTLAANSNRTISKVKVSTIFNLMFGKIKNKAEFLEAVKPIRESWLKDRNIDKAIEELPYFKEKRKSALKAASTRAFEKLMEDYEFLSLEEDKYPLVTSFIKEGKIPISTFFRKKEQYFLLNDNWALWEEMLTRHPDVSVELAQEVSKRTTYEKDLMSYFFFLLYTLPEYLKKHTGLDWTCEPRLIDSPSELDPPTTEENGVARKRSALTPVVDNTKRVVTVPYASLGMPGRQTTYCYSHNYHVVDRGLVFNGNVAMSGVEEKLNGRDDYGLMFYTLTGSEQGRGYPTFLIIFEKRKTGPYLHFHRVHPCRSKDGDYNPIHNWIKTAYNWMAGNVNRKLLKAQQGDLIFAETTDEGKNFDSQVNNYDNHMFATQVLFAKYEKKDKANILGYVKLKEATVLNHHEHDALKIPAGTYEIRQCRSWEANPSGVWTLRID